MRAAVLALVASLFCPLAVAAERSAAVPGNTSLTGEASLAPARVGELRALKRTWLRAKLDDARVAARERALQGTVTIATAVVVPFASVGTALGVASVGTQLQGAGAQAAVVATAGIITLGAASCLALPLALVCGLTQLGEVEQLEHEVELHEAKLASFEAMSF